MVMTSALSNAQKPGSGTKRRAVFHQSRLNGLKLLRPPYGARFDALARWLMR